MLGAIYVMWLRELKRYTRSRAQMVASLGQPLLYLFAFGMGFGPMFARANGGGSYIQFIAPGVIGMGLLFTSVFNGIGLLWDRQFGFLKETLVAPVPRLGLMIGRTLGSATVAVIQASLVMILCLLFGFRPYSWAELPLAFAFMLLIALVFSGLGIAIGSVLQNMQGFQMIMTFLVMPIYFLSGAMFPIGGQNLALITATRIDPLSYGIDGLRGVLLGPAAQAQFHWSFDMAVLAGVAVLFLALGTRMFSRIEI
jgi:ABC-2 type transport system permease protein